MFIPIYFSKLKYKLLFLLLASVFHFIDYRVECKIKLYMMNVDKVMHSMTD